MLQDPGLGAPGPAHLLKEGQVGVSREVRDEGPGGRRPLRGRPLDAAKPRSPSCLDSASLGSPHPPPSPPSPRSPPPRHRSPGSQQSQPVHRDRQGQRFGRRRGRKKERGHRTDTWSGSTPSAISSCRSRPCSSGNTCACGFFFLQKRTHGCRPGHLACVAAILSDGLMSFPSSLDSCGRQAMTYCL